MLYLPILMPKIWQEKNGTNVHMRVGEATLEGPYLPEIMCVPPFMEREWPMCDCREGVE